MTAKTLLKATLIGLIVLAAAVVVVTYWQTILTGLVVLAAVAGVIWMAITPAPPLSEQELERRRRSFVNYQIAQQTAERSEAHREAMAQWRQQQQPPPRDPGAWGGGGGGPFC